MTIQGDETVGAAAFLVPIDRTTPAIPVLDVARGILHVEELAIAPERALGIACLGINRCDLIGQYGQSRKTKKAGGEITAPGTQSRTGVRSRQSQKIHYCAPSKMAFARDLLGTFESRASVPVFMVSGFSMACEATLFILWEKSNLLRLLDT